MYSFNGFSFLFQDVRCRWQRCDWSRRNDQDRSGHIRHAWRRRHQTYWFSWGTRQEHFFTYGRKWRWSSDRRRIPKGLSPGWWALQNVGAECGPIIVACPLRGFHRLHRRFIKQLLLQRKSIFTIIFLHIFSSISQFPPCEKKIWKHITKTVSYLSINHFVSYQVTFRIYGVFW